MNPRNTPSRIMADALSYHAAGASVIPIRRGTKKPACRKWTPYERQRPDEKTLRRWFANGAHGIGLIMGAVSGGLICRDFDKPEAYPLWAAAHPDLALRLPTVATARGRHVYGRAALDVIPEPGVGDGGVVEYQDGELRLSGCYNLAPPSRHPSGFIYGWLIPMPASVADVPLIDLEGAGLRRCWVPDCDPIPDETERTENTETTEEHRGRQRQTEADRSNGGGVVVTPPPPRSWLTPETRQRINEAIRDTLPKAGGRRNRAVFELCRALRAIPDVRDTDPKELRPIVQAWHKAALPVIGTKPFEETLIDFLKGWARVKFPRGAEPIREAFEAGMQHIPAAAAAYEQEPVRLLLALCTELQRRAGDSPFYLDVRTAGRLLGVPHPTAWRWLFLLQADGHLIEVEKGGASTRRASRYRYIGPGAGRAST